MATTLQSLCQWTVSLVILMAATLLFAKSESKSEQSPQPLDSLNVLHSSKQIQGTAKILSQQKSAKLLLKEDQGDGTKKRSEKADIKGEDRAKPNAAGDSEVRGKKNGKKTDEDVIAAILRVEGVQRWIVWGEGEIAANDAWFLVRAKVVRVVRGKFPVNADTINVLFVHRRDSSIFGYTLDPKEPIFNFYQDMNLTRERAGKPNHVLAFVRLKAKESNPPPARKRIPLFVLETPKEVARSLSELTAPNFSSRDKR